MYEKTGFTRTGAARSGFGFTHDGAFTTLFEFFQLPFFTFGSNLTRRDMEKFMLAWDTDIAPAVGAAQTVDASNKNAGGVISRINTLIQQADLTNIDLIVKGKVGGIARGYRYAGSDLFESDRVSDPFVHKDTLRAWADTGAELTFLGVPPGCGLMKGIDRDGDGYWDRDELDNASDPANPLSTPLTGGVAELPEPGDERLLGGLVRRLEAYPNPVRTGRSRIEFDLKQPADVTLRVFDPQGRLVRTLIDGRRSGPISAEWDLRDEGGRLLPSGVYFYRLESERFFEARRLTVIR
jgi:hypothetical protein